MINTISTNIVTGNKLYQSYMYFDEKKLTSVLLLHFLRTHHNKTNFK